MIKNIFQKRRKKEKGFVILFAVLISIIVLAITIGISNIAYKEVALSTPARDSHYAYYAADTGAECALYNDIKVNNGTGIFDGSNPNPSMDCGTGQPIQSSPAPGINQDGTPYTIYDFSQTGFDITNENPANGAQKKYCSKVRVTKHLELIDPATLLPVLDLNGAPIHETQIDSFGYNIPCGSPNDTRTVERYIYVHYAEQ